MTDARTLTRALGGKWYGGSGLAFCPAHENIRTPALSVKDGDDGKLLVHCFVGCDARVIFAALREKGLLEGSSNWRPDPQKLEQRNIENEADRQRKISIARRCWAEAGPISGTLAERYLRARGITCQLSTTLRFHPNCWHGPTATNVPAMVAAVVIGGEIIGVHRTYLAEPGIKAFTANAKMILGRCAGGAVRLSGGPGPLVIAEGIETALSVLSGLHDHQPRVWAALSTSGMAGLILPPESGELVLAPDGDAPGRKAANKLADRANIAGWSVRIMDCPTERDWNDIAQEVAS